MAENIDASIIGLKNSIDALSARIRSTGERRMQSLVSSPSLARVNKLIETSAEIDRIYEQRSKAKDLVRAGRAMRHDPDRWSSPDEYLRWESATRSRRRKEFDREQGVMDAVRKIVNPDLQHKYDLERRYGRTGASQILAAEADAMGEESRKAYEWDILSDSERNFRTLTDKYGGGPEGEARARDVIAKRQRENLARLDMSDYEQFVHDNAGAYGGREGADQAYRKMLIKQLPPFFKDSKLSTKSLLAIQQVMKSTRGIPLVGPTLHRMITNPVAGVAGAGYAALLAGFQASNKSNEALVDWQNKANLYGTPSRKFAHAALLAGFKDPGQISKVYGELTSRFGNAEMFMSSIGSTLGAMDPLARMRLAKDLGLDETTMALIDIFTQNKHLSIDEARKTNKNLHVVDVVKQMGYATGSGFGKTAQSWWLSIPGMSSGAARDMNNFSNAREGYMSDFWDGMENAVDKTHDAAQSLSDTEKAQGSTANYNSSSNHAVYINEVNVASNNPEEFVGGMESISDRGSVNNRAVLASMGTGMLA